MTAFKVGDRVRVVRIREAALERVGHYRGASGVVLQVREAFRVENEILVTVWINRGTQQFFPDELERVTDAPES